MALSLSEFNQFKKLMALTTSDNDGEALNALRQANRIIARQKVTWPQVLDRVIKVEIPIESGEDQDLEAIFEAAMENVKGNFRDVIEDIYSKWQQYGHLTPRQREVVVNAARR